MKFGGSCTGTVPMEKGFPSTWIPSVVLTAAWVAFAGERPIVEFTQE